MPLRCDALRNSEYCPFRQRESGSSEPARKLPMRRDRTNLLSAASLESTRLRRNVQTPPGEVAHAVALRFA